jgi:hypothetical protein
MYYGLRFGTSFWLAPNNNDDDDDNADDYDNVLIQAITVAVSTFYLC